MPERRRPTRSPTPSGAVGTGWVALGSDYPFPLGEAVPGRLIESLAELDAATRDRLFAGTALEFLGRTRDAFV